MVIDGKRCSIAKTDQPRVQRLANLNVLAGTDSSFNRFTGPEHQTRAFTYSVDDQARPLLTITDAAKRETVVSWDPETRRITRYGDWKYDIKLSDKYLSNAAIGRTNAKGQREFWHYDGAQGQEVVYGIEGVKKVTSWFTSGKLAGKLREISFAGSAGNTKNTKYIYDQNGYLIRRQVSVPNRNPYIEGL